MAKASKAKTYLEFLKTYDGSELTDKTFAKRRQEATGTFDKSQSTYGTNAEYLATKGLTGSGYAKYLDDKAKRTLTQSEGAIASLQEAEQKKRFSSYETYLKQLEKEKTKVYGQIHRSILSTKTTNLDKALQIARIYGLSDEEARESVENAVALNIETKKQEILTKIRNNRTTSERAVSYGQKAGLPEDVIEELREFAEKLYGASSSDDYQNYTQANE